MIQTGCKQMPSCQLVAHCMNMHRLKYFHWYADDMIYLYENVSNIYIASQNTSSFTNNIAASQLCLKSAF